MHRIRLIHTVVLGALAGAFPLAACSSLDPTALGGPSGDHPVEGEGDAAPPNDDPSIGGETVEPEGGDAGASDAAGRADGGGAPVDPGPTCVKGGLYCGGDKVAGDPKVLYRCNAPAAPSVVEVCTAGCLVNPGANDACAPVRVVSPVPGRVVTYPYGVKNSSYAAGYHTGDDYAAPTGSSVVAVRSGTIRWSNDNGGAYGKWIGLDADNGRTYVYCHLSSRSVASGTKVVAGQALGKVGSTGNTTGPHLHFEDHPLGPFVYAQVRKPAW